MNTKKYIEAALLTFLKKKTIDKIKVNEIILEVGTCKGTFYKYYQDKYELLLSCFQNNFYQDLLEVDSDWENFMLRCLGAFEKNPLVVLNAFKSDDVNSIKNYHERLIASYLENDIKNICGTSVNEVNSFSINTCAACYTDLTIKWLENGMRESKEELITFMRAAMPQSIYPIIYVEA